MKKVFLFFGILLANLLNAQQYLPPEVKWQFTLNDTSLSQLKIAEIDKDHFFVIQMVQKNDLDSSMLFLLEIDSSGIIFNKKLAQSYFETGFDLLSVKKTSDGYIILSNLYSINPSKAYKNQIRILKIDKEGKIVFELGFSAIHINDITILDDNSFLLSGVSNLSKPLLCKVDKHGTILWKKTYNYGSYGLKVLPLNQVEFGQIVALSNGNSYFQITDTLGNNLKTFYFAGNIPSTFGKNNNDSSFIFLSNDFLLDATGSNLQNLNVQNLNKDNSVLAKHIFTFPKYFEISNNLEVKNDSNFVGLITTSTNNIFPSNQYNYFNLFRLSSSGDTIWTKMTGGVKGESLVATDFVLLSDGGYAVVGFKTDSVNSSKHKEIFVYRFYPDMLNSINSTFEPYFKQVFQVFPNPTEGNIIVKADDFANNPFFFSLFDTKGTLLFSREISQQNDNNLSFCDFPTGVYLFEIKNQRFKQIGKLIVKR